MELTVLGVGDTISDRVRRRRQALKISQEKLANEARCSSSTITRLERGVTVPDTDTLENIAAALGVTLSELLGEPAPLPSTGVYASLRGFLERHGERMRVTDAERRWLSQPLPHNRDIGNDEWWMGILAFYRQQVRAQELEEKLSAVSRDT